MRYYITAVYLFLYTPIALIVLFSFNAGRHAASFECCATVWYGRTFDNTFLLEALFTSLFIAGTTAVLATVMGTMASLALHDAQWSLYDPHGSHSHLCQYGSYAPIESILRFHNCRRCSFTFCPTCLDAF